MLVFVCSFCITTAVSSCVIGAGMVVDWEQETGLLMTSGDVRVIRIWDTDREMKVQVLYLPAGKKLGIHALQVCY